MAEIKYNDIQSIDESWENYAGSSVEKFIKQQLKSKAGYIYRSQNKEGDYYYLYGFSDYEQYEAWAGGDSSIVPLFRVQLPNVENDTFSVNLTTNSNTSKIVNLGDGVIVGLKYTSISTNPTTGVSVDTYNDGTLIIQRSVNGSVFSEVGRVTIQPIPYTENRFANFDLTPYLVDGDNKIRLRVQDNVTGGISANITFQSVVNTTLVVENNTATNEPLRALQFQYYIQGQVAKTLHIRIKQGNINQVFDFTIGENTYIEVPYTTPLINLAVENGIVEVESWLSVDGSEVVSNSDVSQFYFSDGTSTETVIILNDVSTNVINYTNEHLFDMTLYNNSADVNVKIQSVDGQRVYQDLTFNNVQTGVVFPVYSTLEIESNTDSINCVVVVTSIEFNCSPYTITVDNSEKMSPVPGADFVLNPKVRNNSNSNKNVIINDVNGNTVSSTFTGFGFVNDGWVADEDNIHILRIPSNHTLTINYDVFSNLQRGTSIELDYKVNNIFNDSDEVIKMYTTTEDDVVLGFVMNATEAAFYTSENQTKRDQDVMFQEGVRTHLVINIVPNLANSGLNYIRLFVNGILNREMLYSNSDVFKNGTCRMVFGSQNADIDIYGIRVYKTGLSASDIRQNYMSSLPDINSKTAFKDANDILSSNGTISYDKAKLKYNTLVWTGSVPSYSTGDNSYTGSLNINILGDAAHSGNITGLKIKGQGSSSKGYWKWNHQYDWNKIEGVDTTWTDGNGDVHTDGYTLTDNDPAAKKLVAKLNWASSMQSHKLGSTAMYTDLWRTVVGGNSITNTEGYEKVRVSVNEKPFLYFVKETPNAQPVFYGLMTFGSGKFDKPTFGYDKNVFPDYLVLEGSDNGMPLTLRQVPWFSDEVTYNAGEEYYEYAGQGNLDYGMGKQENITYFQDAFNFTYLHSPFLVSFTGSISSDADKKNQYWDTVTKNVFRYDYISQEWVNAGTTKTNGEYDVLNLETQTGLTRNSYSSDAEFTEAVISWRKTDFKNRIGTYYNTTDVLYSLAFLKLIAASDNWCKNTYEYLDPVTHKICLAQDDMDTIMLTDNVGRKNKPYYVEEQDLDPSGKPYFNGSTNVFYYLMSVVFESEEKAMLKQILNTMSNVHNSVKECIQDYFFDVQEYFPAVAFNETARLLYEEASVKQSQGIYVNGTPAISQSLGDQLQGEKQWWNRRIPYMQSWCSADPFYTRSTVEPNLQFRSMTTTISTDPSYTFNLTPWQWLYPKVGTGQFLSYDNTRVPAGNQYVTVTMNTDGNTDTFIYGSNYYTSYGEFGGVSLSETFNLVGDRLLEFSADSRQVSRYDFRPSRMTVNCPVLRTLCLYGCSTLTGSLDLSGCKRLVSVDLRGTNVSSVILPETDTLTTVYLPAVTSLIAVGCSNISTFVLSGYNNLLSFTTDNSDLAVDIMENAGNIANLTLIDIDITTDSSNVDDVFEALTNPDCTYNITGSIYLDKSLTDVEKNVLENIYGSNVFVEGNALYISFIVTPITTVTLSATKYSLGNNDELWIQASCNGNDDVSTDWTVTSSNTLTVTEFKKRIKIESGTLESVEQVTVTATVTKSNGSTVSQSMFISLVPYTFYINGTEVSNFTQTILYGSGDSSVTYSDGWTITCNGENVVLSINGITVQGGSATYSGTGITSITKTTFADNTDYDCNVELLVNNVSYTITFKVKTVLVSLTINNIPTIQAINGSGSGNVTFSYNNIYQTNLTTVSAIVSGGNTNTVSDLSINGCTINVSGYTASDSRILTVTYKVNGGSNCTVSKSFSINYIKSTGKATITYSITSTGETQILSSNSNCDISGIGRMRVENVEVTPSKTYNFTTTGTKTVEVEAINGYDFKYLLYLISTVTSVTFTNTTILGSSVCESCSNLTNVNLIGTINSIGYNAFKDCSKLGKINCSSLTKCPTITRYTFDNIKTNGRLLYPNNLNFSTWLSRNAGYLSYYHWNWFYNQETGITYAAVDNGNHTYYGVVINTMSSFTNDLEIKSTFRYNNQNVYVTEIFNGAFRNKNTITSIIIPYTVNTIGNLAFDGCSKLNSITINRSTAPTIYNSSFGYNSTTAGYSSGTTNVLYVPSDATGYDSSNWTDYLLNASYGKFTLSKTLVDGGGDEA